MRAVYGFTACTILALFQGWRTFVPPMAIKDFVAAYIAVSVWQIPLHTRFSNVT
jgi:amino acid permease